MESHKTAVRRERIPDHFPYWAATDGKIYIDEDDDGVGKLLKPSKSKGGVWQVNIWKRSIPGVRNPIEPKLTKASVARLVCLTFHGIQDSTVKARHRDPDKPKDNSIHNVYWDLPEPWLEEWDDDYLTRPIPPNDDYWAHQDGMILEAKRRRVVPQIPTSNGPPVVNLIINEKRTTRSVANLVALAWLGCPPDGYGETKSVFVRHKDGNKLNNAASNLYWYHPGLTAPKKQNEGVSGNGK